MYYTMDQAAEPLTWLNAAFFYKVLSAYKQIAFYTGAPASVNELATTRRDTPGDSSPDDFINLTLLNATFIEQELLSTPLLFLRMHDRLRRRRAEGCHADFASMSASGRRGVLEQAGCEQCVGLWHTTQPLKMDTATCPKTLPSNCCISSR